VQVLQGYTSHIFYIDKLAQISLAQVCTQ